MKKSHWRQNSNRPGHGWARRNKSRGRGVTHSLHSCITATRAIDHQTMRVPVGSHPALVGSCTWKIIIAIEENCRVVNILARRHFHRSGATPDWRGDSSFVAFRVWTSIAPSNNVYLVFLVQLQSNQKQELEIVLTLGGRRRKKSASSEIYWLERKWLMHILVPILAHTRAHI